MSSTLKIQSGWAVDTNLIVRCQLYEAFVDQNSGNEIIIFLSFDYLVNCASAAFTATVSKNDSRDFSPL